LHPSSKLVGYIALWLPAADLNFVNQRLHILVKIVGVLRNNIPEDVVVYSIVSMRQPVPHSNYLAPWNLWMLLANVLGDSGARLADQLNDPVIMTSQSEIYSQIGP